jgi:uncharacterized protein YdaU (DUF1376 family)
MARLPWFPFYPADWFRDTKCLSFEAKGAWIDILGILWDSKTRGSKTLNLDTWASELGKPRPMIEAVFNELNSNHIAQFATSVTGNVTVRSRRQMREEKARKHSRLRVSKFRKRQCNGDSNASVTVQSQNQSQNQSQKKIKTKILVSPPKGDKSVDKSNDRIKEHSGEDVTHISDAIKNFFGKHLPLPEDMTLVEEKAT